MISYDKCLIIVFDGCYVVLLEVEEVVNELWGYIDSIEFDFQCLLEVEFRFVKYIELVRKYGVKFEELSEYYVMFVEEFV